MEPQEDKKSHRQRHSGRKAEKKKKKDPFPLDESAKQRNPKAFAFNSAIRAERRFRRKEDINTKKQHVPTVDRTPVELPPILVAVVGPPKVGKSTLIKNLIKLYTRSPLVDIKGPVTVVIGKKRRVTFMECNNDINCMIDLAKVADLVLLMCDASFGFEMEVFEFLNVCQVHGMPKIMGVLTHLDMIKNSKTLKTTKKVLKHRFWTEVYPGAKLFYLSGIIHEEYLRNEIKNLGRFISVMKVRPLTWRNTHAYVLADRLEDLTNQELVRKEPKCNRHVSLYGYVRGVPMKHDCTVHVAGMGDFKIGAVSYLPDPCPLPEHIKKRALIEKEKFIYAPFSGVGGIVYDKDAVYVELGGSHSHDNKDDNGIVTNMIDAKNTIDYKLAQSKVQLFTGGEQLTADDFVKSGRKEEEVLHGGRTRRRVVFEDDADEEECEDSDEMDSDTDNRKSNQKSKLSVTELNEESSDDKEDKGSTFAKRPGKTSKMDKVCDEKEETEGSDEEESCLLDLKNRTQKEYKKNVSLSEDELDQSDEESVSTAKDSIKLTNNVKHNIQSESSSDESAEDNDSDVAVNHSKSSKKSTTKKEKETKSKNDIHSKVSNILKMLETKQTKKSDVVDIDSDDDEETIQDSNISFVKEEESNDDSENDEEVVSLTGFPTYIHKDGDMESDCLKLEENEDDTKWKTNLAERAREAFFNRQQTTQNLMKIVYGNCSHSQTEQPRPDPNASADHEEDDYSGGLFKTVSRDQQQRQVANQTQDSVETALHQLWSAPTVDWTEQTNRDTLINCFVTGQWKESEDADELLRLDDTELPSGSDEDGDFEDLETGEVHTAKTKRPHSPDKNEDIDALKEKKRRLKEKFDQEYDNKEGSTFYDNLKEAATKQSELNRSVFANMPDDLRIEYEGYRPGMYVRMELREVPYEFVANFDPTYPIVVGVVNHGEENIGYVNVKIKKHRWYSKILKSGDPLIISLGWRRFQTVPLYSKLEDDLKFRYLKYTPEHLGCNAHFWGPITPQNTGFIALQSVEHNPDDVKRLGFKIAASGVVQELDKTTRIVKKLKLIGQPLKIYKKTAFIKGMFNSSLEVARFEGARLKTVSGIRGQIKKAVNKPEGCFRATFEDKILLSDLVFCRTWYKVDVPQYYNPLTNLLLPIEEKNRWKGAKTTGEMKREKGIKNLPNLDHLYTPIEREEKPFKPLAIPAQLQKALPYKDKPKHGVKFDEKKNPIQRVAVVREPKEEKIAKLMKMVKANYEHKQGKLKKEAKERIEKHKEQVMALEAFKDKKLKEKKKEVFRMRSKAQNSKKNM